MTTLALVIPDIFKPLQFGNSVEPSLFPRVGALCELLSRAQRSNAPAGNYHDLLFHLFQISMPSDGRLPIAALTCLADCEDDDDRIDTDWLVRMDPVHLQPDRDHLMLLDNHSIQLDADAAEKIVSMLNLHFESEAEPFSIVAGAAGRWYVKLKSDPGIHTHPLADVIGRNIDPFLLTGDQRQYWHSLMTEVQMLLHTHHQNSATATGTGLPVNSVWLWGEGSLSSLDAGDESSDWQCVYAGDALSKGLALFSHVRLDAVPQSATQWLQQADLHGKHMIVMDDFVSAVKYGDLPAWQALVTQFNDDWIVPIFSALKRGDLETLLVYEGNGRCYRITDKQARRWWKRTGALQRCI